MKSRSWVAPSVAAVVVIALVVALMRLSATPPDPLAAYRGLALDSVRPIANERFYFVLTDRFANGDPSNDRGGLSGDRMVTGYDPTDKGFFHGGDLAGLRQRLDYIKGLGTTALWLSPAFVNEPVSGTGADASAGYHGYWITDFTRIDPHLGTNDEMKSLIDQAHAKGMKVFFDIVTNHTADVISLSGSRYVGKLETAYKDSSGREFDDVDYIGKPFPAMSAATSFPYVPTFRTPADATKKVPAWLNDPTLYHNRGDSTFAGESSTYGDFFGLDDLFTERPEVVDGMTTIYQAWADMGIDGFRIDTVKHVNIEFWQQFSPRILDHVRKGGKADFWMFGEVNTPDSSARAVYSTTGKLQATLDFGFQARASRFVTGGSADGLRQLMLDDDLFADADSNVYANPIFLSNHDLGRFTYPLTALASGDELLKRDKLAHALMYTFRGHPVVYYGDEQGLVGSGGDKDSRQDLFATKTAQYAGEQVIGGPAGSLDRYDPNHPMYAEIQRLAQLRQQHPALADGGQTLRYTDSNLVAFSRIKASEAIEYVVVANNADRPGSASVPTYSPGIRFVPVWGGGEPATAGADGTLDVSVDGLGVRVYRAEAPIPALANTPTITLASRGEPVTRGTLEVRAVLDHDTYAQVTFAVRTQGSTEWRVLATDDSAPFTVSADVSDIGRGTPLEIVAVGKDVAGRVFVSPIMQATRG